MDRAQTGHRGEAIAAKFYLQQGYRLLTHNFRTRMGELDLVLEKDGVIVICEVKTRTANAVIRPGAAVDYNKQKKLVLAAQLYLQQTDRLEQTIRFDVAEVICLPEGKWQVHLIKNAFEC